MISTQTLILDWLQTYLPIATWLGSITSIVTLIFAWLALSTWRKQKEYELLIENLANTNLARDYIIGLRLLFTDDIKGTEEELQQIKLKEFNDTYSKTLAERIATIQIRQDRNQRLREKLSYLKERNGAYGLTNEFHLFYKRILDIEFEVSNTAKYLYDLVSNENRLQPRDTSDDDRLRAVIHFQQGDEITTEIDRMIKGLEKYRKKGKFRWSLLE